MRYWIKISLCIIGFIPFSCEICGLVLANFNLLQEHVAHLHKTTSEHCKYCDHTVENREALQTHLIEAHEELVILHTMANQVNQLDDGAKHFETFKIEVMSLLKSMYENQNVMRQELFLIRNNQENIASEGKKKKDNNSEKADQKVT